MADHDVDTAALPATEPHSAPIFDTGPHPTPMPLDHDTAAPRVVPAAAPLVPGQDHLLRWWKLVLVFVGVWIPAAGIGLGLFSWWYTLVDKTPAVFVVLVYVVGCTVAGLILAMVPDKALVAALAIALMSAVYASALAAAPLYGHYYCQHVSRCVAGIIPY